MDISKLQKYLDDMPKRGIILYDLAISKDGKEIYRHMDGYRDIENKHKIDKNTLYWIYSNSKVITCTAAMRLLEEGKIHLDDPVSKYLPAFKDMKVECGDGNVRDAQNEMKIIHLFTMTGGLDYNFGKPSIMEARNMENADTISICSAMAKDPLHFEPGTRYSYSLCHDVLAAVVEVASGMRFSEYLDKIIFTPLEINKNNMGFVPNNEQTSRLAQAYDYNNAKGTATPISNNNGFRLSGKYESGGAGLFSSVDEYMKVINALSLGGTALNGYRLLKEETVEMMEVNRLCDDAWRDFVGGRLYGYGWGLCGRVHVDPVRSMSLSSVGEFGWDGAHAAFSMVDRKNRVALYFATQLSGCSYAYTDIHPRLRNFAIELLN